MIRRVVVACTGLVALAAVGCQQPDQHALDALPEPGSRPRYVQAPPVRQPPARRNYSLWWPATPPGSPPRWSPIGKVAPELGWVPAVGISSRWKYIVVHHSASEIASPQAMDNAHRARGWDELGYHFVIGDGRAYPDGQVFIGPRWKKQKYGAHCKTPGAEYNQYGIGICLMGNLDNHRPTERQMQSLARLVGFLENRCGIPPDRVLTHGGITHKTQCPGKHFSKAELLIRVNAYR
jgi:hypothetical protein